MVYDFRGMTEAQILDIFMQSGQKLCGVYDAGRLTSTSKTQWQKWLSAAIITLGLGASTQITYAQQNNGATTQVNKLTDSVNTSAKNFTMGEIEILPRATFPDGYKALQSYIHKSVGDKNGFKGQVTASFTVETDGSLSNIKFLTDEPKAINDKILYALKQSPKWQPVMQANKAIKSNYVLFMQFPEAKP